MLIFLPVKSQAKGVQMKGKEQEKNVRTSKVQH